MGTGISGRYYTSHGSKKIHHQALIHSFDGKFIKPDKGKLRLDTGGHGQSALDFMDKNGIEYHIVKTFNNGVRIGNVPNCKKKSKRTGTGMAWFPKNWTQKDMVRAGEHFAGLKANRKAANGKAVFGTYKGVRVGIIKTNGQVATVFPDNRCQPKPKKSGGKK